MIPVEFNIAMKWWLPAALLFLLAGGIGKTPYWAAVWSQGGWAALALFVGVVAGAVVTPLLLPVLPGRAFALKGGIAGFVGGALLVWGQRSLGVSPWSTAETGAWLFLVSTLASFLGMEFTGASTYTSLSGVKKEMRMAVPCQIAAGGVGLVLWFIARLTA